jgi:hypothetical protein
MRSSPSHTAWVQDAALQRARAHLGPGADQLVNVAVIYVTSLIPATSEAYTSCSPAAHAVLDLLTAKKASELPRRWLKDVSDPPGRETRSPTVTLVSLTSAADSFGSSECHQLVVIGAQGRFRLLQACQGCCSMGDFVTHPKFGVSWSAEEYKAWWGKLVDAERSSGGVADAGSMRELIGVPYDGPLGRSVVVTSPVQLYLS